MATFATRRKLRTASGSILNRFPPCQTYNRTGLAVLILSAGARLMRPLRQMVQRCRHGPLSGRRNFNLKSTFHHGSLKSNRLKNILRCLKNAGMDGTTTFEILNHCYPTTTRPSSDISELRANGIKIKTKYEGKSVNGRKIFSYKLVK